MSDHSSSKGSLNNKIVDGIDMIEEDQDIDLALKQLKEEEKNESQYVAKRHSTEVEKAKSVKTQKKLFD